MSFWLPAYIIWWRVESVDECGYGHAVYEMLSRYWNELAWALYNNPLIMTAITLQTWDSGIRYTLVPKLSTVSSLPIVPATGSQILNQCFVLCYRREHWVLFSDSPWCAGLPILLGSGWESPYLFGVGLEERFVKTFAEAIALLLQVFLWSMGPNFALK